MKKRWAHYILQKYYQRERLSFAREVNCLEQVQRQILNETLYSLKGTRRNQDLLAKSYEELRSIVPIAEYSDFKELIEQQRRTGTSELVSKIIRFEPTSGSTEQRKWIPYTPTFLKQINRAAAAWLGDVYAQHPEVARGTHYWSLTWLPQELRGLTSADDSQLFPWYERWLLGNIMAVPGELAQVISQEQVWWATLRVLWAKQDLSLVSVWSPTLLLRICQDIQTHWSELSRASQSANWGRFDHELQTYLGPAPGSQLGEIELSENWRNLLWPKLQFISCWGSSTSELWFKQLQKDFPKIVIQAKGLWATEGVVSIPFAGQLPLAYRSHFFEFRDLTTGEVLPSWQIKKDQVYQPILWNGTGMLRYLLPDKVEVVGFMGQVPCLQFLGRIQSTDMVGEKISTEDILNLQKKFPQCELICAVAVQKPQPHYVFVLTGDTNCDLEREMRQHHHYNLARELGQLGELKVYPCHNPLELLSQLAPRQSGYNKPELLYSCQQFRN